MSLHGPRKKYGLPLLPLKDENLDENIKNMQRKEWKSFAKSLQKLKIMNARLIQTFFKLSKQMQYFNSQSPQLARLASKAKNGMIDIKANRAFRKTYYRFRKRS